MEALLRGESEIVDLSVVTRTLDRTVVVAVCLDFDVLVAIVVNFGRFETSFSSQIGFSHPKRQIC